MNLCVLNFSLTYGGAEKQIIQLAKYWSKRKDINIDVVLFSNEGLWTDEITNYVQIYILSKVFPKNHLKKLSWSFVLIPKLKRHFNRKKYDIILTFLWLPTLIAIWSKPNEIPILWSVQSDLQEAIKIHKDRIIREFLIKKFIVPNVKCFLPISSGLSKKLINWLNLPHKKINLIPNSIDLNEIEVKAKIPTEKIPSKRKRFRILTVGRFHIAKGMDVFLKSLALLPKNLKNEIEVYIVGNGPERAKLETIRKELELADLVKFVGFSNNPYAWMASADIFISPSRWETFGIVIAEAMALGVPVIATETDGAKDLIVHNKTGILVPVENEKALSQAIEYLLLREDLRINFSKAAKEKVKDFSIEKIAKKYEKVFINVLKNKRSI